MGMRVVTVNDVLDGHVALDIECLDRIYLNAYVPTLQTSAQVAAFLTRHLGFPLPSPASFKQLGDRSADPCARSPTPATSPGWPSISTTTSWRSCVGIWPPGGHGPLGVAAVGVAQEFQRVWTAYERPTRTGAAQYCFTKADRHVTCYYFYLWDTDFGPAPRARTGPHPRSRPRARRAAHPQGRERPPLRFPARRAGGAGHPQDPRP
jgi:hypothetical protein